MRDLDPAPVKKRMAWFILWASVVGLQTGFAQTLVAGGLSEHSGEYSIDRFRRLPSGNAIYDDGARRLPVVRPGAVVEARVVSLSTPQPSADARARGLKRPTLETVSEFFTIVTLEVVETHAGVRHSERVSPRSACPPSKSCGGRCMEIHRDFSDLLACSTDANAEFVLVGAYALALHGVPRATG